MVHQSLLPDALFEETQIVLKANGNITYSLKTNPFLSFSSNTYRNFVTLGQHADTTRSRALGTVCRSSDRL